MDGGTGHSLVRPVPSLAWLEYALESGHSQNPSLSSSAIPSEEIHEFLKQKEQTNLQSAIKSRRVEEGATTKQQNQN